MSEAVEKFLVDLIEYARERNRFIILGEPAYIEYANVLPCPVPPESIRPWTEDEIESARRQLVESPTRKQTLEIFLKFLIQETQNLVPYGGRPGFYRQQAFNLAANGPIERVAAVAVESAQRSPMLLREPVTRPAYNPFPAVTRVLEKQSEYVPKSTGPYESEPRLRAFQPVLAISLDGRRAVSANLDGNMWAWDFNTGRLVHTLQGRKPQGQREHPDMVTAAALSPDGRLVASRTFDGEVRVWDFETGHCQKVLSEPSQQKAERWQLDIIGLTADAKILIEGAATGDLSVWDVDTGECIHQVKQPDGMGNVTCLCANRGLAVSAHQSKLVVWDVLTGKSLRVFEGHDDEIFTTSISAEGRFVISGSRDKTCRVWNVENGECNRVLEHSELVTEAAVTSDGCWAITVATDDYLRYWDLNTGKQVRQLKVDQYDLSSLTLTPDGALVVSMDSNRAVRVWDLQRGQITDTPVHKSAVSRVQFNVAGTRLISTDRSSVEICKLSSFESESRLEQGVGAISNDGHTGISLAQGDQDADQIVHVWDLYTGRKRTTLKGHEWYIRSANIDDNRVFTSSNDKTLKIWDSENGECVRTITSIGWWADVLLPARDRRGVFTFDRMEGVRRWDIETGECVQKGLVHITGDILCPLVFPDECLASVATTGYNQMYVANMLTRELPKRLNSGAWPTTHEKTVKAWALSPDGRTALSASSDCTIGVWDIKSGACRTVLKGHSHWVTHVEVTRDGRYLISFGRDRTIRVWNLLSGECLLVYAHTTDISSIAIRGDLIVIGDASGYVSFLRVRNQTSGPPLTTLVFRYSRDTQRWDRAPTASCPTCGYLCAVEQTVISEINAITSGLKEDESPCLELPEAAWEAQRLIIGCAQCRQSMRLNPFIVDNRARYSK